MAEGGVAHQGNIITIGDAIDDGIDVGSIVEGEAVVNDGVFGVAKRGAVATGWTFGDDASGGGFECFLVEHHQDKEVGSECILLTNILGDAEPNGGAVVHVAGFGIAFQVDAFIAAGGAFGQDAFFSIAHQGIVIEEDAVGGHDGIRFGGVVIHRIENGDALSGVEGIGDAHALGGFVFEGEVAVFVDFCDAVSVRCGTGIGIPHIEVGFGMKPVDGHGGGFYPTRTGIAHEPNHGIGVVFVFYLKPLGLRGR